MSMDDTNQATAQTPVDLAASTKDPLSVLEELLAKQKESGGAVAAPTPDTEAAAKEGTVAQQQAEYERIQAEAGARDAQLLAQQEAKMHEIAASPQYQARVEQNQSVKQEKQDHDTAQEGFEIAQLSTARVPVGEPTE